MKQLKNQKGFTLVEIAIVLVIIGLLLGGVLKGQSMIESAKLKRLISETQGLAAAVYTYQDKYRSLPGDDPKATTNLPSASGGCVAGDLVNGNGDGRIYEYWAAAEHLACAGMIKGTFNGTSEYIKNAYGGNVIIYYDTLSGKAGNDIRHYNLAADVAKALDEALDDGIYNTGSVRANEDYTTANSPIDQTGYYF